MTNKLKFFIGNWKMFGDLSAIRTFSQINRFYSNFKIYNKRTRIILCVPNTLIYFFYNKIKSRLIPLGAQNSHHEEKFGPYTGSVSASMLKKVGAKYIILGHSENRQEGDTNKLIKKKIKSALNQNLNVIFCIGETISEKKRGQTFSILKRQIKESLSKNNKKKFNKIIIAYEPVWAIGTGNIPNLTQLAKIINFIKNQFKIIFNTKKIPIVLYGGSVNNKNISVFSQISCIDGFLVGGASQSYKKFIDIIKNYYK